MKKSGLEDVLPLSPMQQGLLFHSTYDEDGADVYTIQLNFAIEGELDAETLRGAAAGVLRRHANLRAAFRSRKNGEPVQVIPRQVELPWAEVDLSGLADNERERELAELVADDRARRFDLTRPPLMRFTLITMGQDRYRFLVTHHHILLDGWSFARVLGELFELYGTRGDDSALPRVTPYREYLTWLDRQDRPAAEAAWRQSLAGLDEPSLIAATDRSAPSLSREQLKVELSVEQTSALGRAARNAGVTVNTVVQAAWAMVLGRLTGRDDVVFGATVSGRPADIPGVESMIGLFINTLPVRVRIDPAETLKGMLVRIQDEQSELMPHQHLGLNEVQRLSGHGELFDSILVFENFPVDSQSLQKSSGALGIVASENRDDTHYPLTIAVLVGETLELELAYQPDVLDPLLAQSLADSLARLLTTTDEDAERPVGLRQLGSSQENELLLAQSTGPVLELSAEQTLHGLLEVQAALTPDATALVCGTQRLTFAELNGRANRMARLLVEQGAGPDQLVALSLPRSADLVVALYAVLKSGAAYLPLDPEYPADRVAYLFGDAAPACLITLGGTAATLPDSVSEVPRIILDDPGVERTLTGLPDKDLIQADRIAPVCTEHLAYVIYTSGSTGRPKGVAVEHRNAVSLFHSQRTQLLRPGSQALGGRQVRAGITAAFTFDASVDGLIWMLDGHELHVIDDEARRDPDQMISYVREQRLDYIFSTPTYLRQLLAAGLMDPAEHRPRLLEIGAEATDDALWQEMRELPDVSAFNYYGPTECTVVTLCLPFAESEKPLIGRPLGNTRAYVLDSRLRMLPAGMAGELYIAGSNVTRGYLGRAGLTSERFVADPYGVSGERMYRTGDVVRRTADGLLEYLGRADDQVKIRGFRIELGEIDSVLTGHESVAHSAVVVREDQPGSKRLVAYVVPAGTDTDTEVLRAHVAGLVPEYMVPSAFVVLDALPMTTNGKLDRKALPAPDFSRRTVGRGPRNEREELLCGLFAEVLGLASVGIDDSFFELGGDSIISIQLVSRARRAGLTLTPRDVFQLRSVEALAAAAKSVEDAPVEQADKDGGVGAVPLTPIVHHLRETGGPVDGFNQAMMMQVPGDYDLGLLTKALQAVLDHHDALRMRLERPGDGTWKLTVPPRGAVRAENVVRRVDAAAVPLSQAAQAAQERLAPGNGVMVQVVWHDAGRHTPGQVLVMGHHLVVDGVSWRILMPDLVAAYEAVAAGREADLEPVGTSFRAWAEGLSEAARSPERLAELDVWTSMLQVENPTLGARELDPARDVVATSGGLSLSLPADLTGALLARVPAVFHAGVNDVLLTGFALAVTDWLLRRGQETSGALIDLEGHGREELVPGADISRTVGWFTSLYPVHLATGVADGGWDEVWAGGTAVGSALKAVKEQLRALPDNGAGYGLLRHLSPETEAVLAALPTPQISFNYLGRLGGSASEKEGDGEGGGLGGAADPQMPLTHALELNAIAQETPDGPALMANWSWARGLFTEDEVRDLAETWFRALRAIAAHAETPGAGGHTPSDLPLVRLAQPQVEELEARQPLLTDVLPLAPLQQGLLFHALYDQREHDVYTVQFSFEISGELNGAALRQAAQTLLRRHSNLRAGFHTLDTGEAVQVIPSEVRLPWTELDLSGLPQARRDAELARHLDEDRSRRFDVSAPPLVRFALVKLAPGEHLFTFTNHHILLDGWSLPVLFGELFELYHKNGDDSGLTRVAPYRDYLSWLEKQDRTAAVGAWARGLEGFEEPTLLAPVDPARKPVMPERVSRELEPEFAALLREKAKDHGVTLNTYLALAWAITLGQLTGRDDVVFGTTVSGRPPEIPGIESMVGLFINTLPVRVRVDADRTVGELLHGLQDQQSELMAYQHVGLTDIRETTGLAELFDSILVYENYPVNNDAIAESLGDLQVRGNEPRDATHYPLGLTVMPISERLMVRADYRGDVFPGDSAARIVELLLRVAKAMTDASLPLRELDLLSADERGLQLGAWNDTALDVPDKVLTVLFEERAAATPDADAVVSGEERLTYGELNRRANRLARRLLAQGARPGGYTAVALPRTVDLLVAMLAVAKTGAAYVPVDPTHPAERIGYIFDTAQPVRVIAASSTAGKLPVADSELIVLDDPATADELAALDGADLTADERPWPLLPTSPAYALFTSGSTGRPKGVVVTGANLINCLTGMRRWIPLEPADRYLALSTIAFDFAALELYLPLFCGASTVIATTDEQRDAAMLGERVRRSGVTVMSATPSLWQNMVTEVPDAIRGVHLIAGGEAVPPALSKAMAEIGSVATNVYGPTETTIVSTVSQLTEEPVSIGAPIANTHVFVLDSQLRLLPVGVPGELYIAGGGVTQGYLGRQVLTAERYVASPYGAPGERMYRTGDQVRWATDGRLEFVDRVDHQVKIRGFRIELGEIEGALAAHPAVGRVSAIVREDRPGDKRIVVYVMPADGAARPSEEELRAVAAERLPEYMLPSAFVVLDAFPLSPNGKLDRRALPAPDFAERATSRAPRTELEERLAVLFADILGLEAVGIDDGFFDLGGHSLLATRLVSRIRSVLDVELAVRQVFERPTVAGLAQALDAAEGSRGALGVMARPAEIPLSSAQRRLWFLNRFEGPNATYNIPLATRLVGEVDADALRAALGDVVVRHESLRTVFPDTDARPRQEVLSPERAVVELPVVDVTADELRGAVSAAAAHGFDVSCDLPLIARLFRVSDEEHVLLVVVHHIAGDGWSLTPLSRDISEAYAARRAGHAPEWEPLPVQYVDYTLWQRQVLGDESDPSSALSKQLDYWRTALDGLPEEVPLPLDRPRPPVVDYRGGTLPMSFPPEVHRRVVELARESGASVFMVMQAAVAALLGKLGAGEDVPVGSVIAGRTDEALDDLVGFFVNTLVLRTDLSGNPSFRELVGRVKETNLAAYANQDVPFERLVEELNPVRSMARHPLFQVMLVFQNNASGQTEVPGARMLPYPTDTDVAKFDLSFQLGERLGPDGSPAGIEGSIEFAAELFDTATVETLAVRLARLLDTVTTDPMRAVAGIDVLTPQERRKILAEWNDTERPVEPTTLPRLFESQVTSNPSAIAVDSEELTLTYAELNQHANRLAHALIERGVGAEDIVALALPRSVDIAVAQLAVVKAGAAYLPVDPDYPAERIGYILDDAAPALVITDTEHAVRLPDGGPAPRLLLDGTDVSGQPAHNPAVPLHTTQPAYLIYTSGSTGRPKGVVVTHHGLASFAAVEVERFDVMGDSRVLQYASPSFDASVLEICMTYAAGATLVVPPPGPLAGDVLAEVLLDREVTHALIPPAALASVRSAAFPAFRSLIVGGDATSAELVDRWAPDRRMVNAYGPTESTVAATIGDPLRAGTGTPTIGRPVHNTRVYILDSGLSPVPAGVAGELYIAGAGLARGYLGRAALTSERFTACPFGGPGKRMYRTGDLARWTTEGEVEYLGRADNQVKVRGFRIELGEIESVLLSHDRVAQAAVVVRAQQSGEPALVAYTVPEGGKAGDSAELRRHLAASLPSYMVPAAFVQLDALPVTPNGKLDNKALPAPDLGELAGSRGPRTPQEEMLCGLFAEALGLERIGIDGNFFELGGDSIVSLQLISRIRSVLGIKISNRAVFETPTVAGLVEILGSGSSSDGFEGLLPLRAGGEKLPLFAVHATGGLAWGYGEFLKQIRSEYPVYGLQARGFRPGDELAGSVPEMAADYIEQIRTVQPHGPYHLLGWSMGALTAYEIATQLQEQGEEIGLLVNLDQIPFEEYFGDGRPEYTEQIVFRALLLVAGFDVASIGEDVVLEYAQVMDMVSSRDSALGSLEPHHIDAFAKVMENNYRIVTEFRPGELKGDMTVVVSTTEHGDKALARMVDKWGPYITGSVETHPMAATHNDMMSPGPAAEIGRMVYDRLKSLG